MQTLTTMLLERGLGNHVLTETQLARLIEGSAQRRHNLVNRAVKAGELQRVRRGLYLLPRRYRDFDCHPYALAQMLVPGSYISLETALYHHGWIPEAVYTTSSIVPETKSSEREDETMGRFSFHPLAYVSGYFLELVAREMILQQATLVARPVRALMDLVCLRKEEWQGLQWFERSLRIEPSSLQTITGDQIRTLKLVYRHKRMQRYLAEMERALGLELGERGQMIELIQQRLKEYQPANPVEEEQATKEIMQEIALYALWRADFFKVAAFQGGTSLRILYGLPRFSEDLDFVLMQPDPNFQWSQYLVQLQSCFEEYGLQSEALPKERMDQRIRRAVIKDRSVVNQLDLSFYRGHESQKMHIKLEIDVEPPAGSGYDYAYLDFPTDHEVCHQDLGSNFALKIHALLCRGFLKGRDWYDFNWYIKRGVSPNLPHLNNALVQYGPWQGQQNVLVDMNWLKTALREKIDSVDWRAAAGDVERFLKPAEVKGLELWSGHFFSSKLEQLA